jgi:catalase
MEGADLSEARLEGANLSEARLEGADLSEAAAVDFVRDAYGHLKAIAVDEGGQILLQRAQLQPDAGVVSARDVDGFITQAKTRQWKREKNVRMLA